MVDKIQKRDGRIVDFEPQKITNAIHKAILAVGRQDGDSAKKLSDQVVALVEKRFEGRLCSVEDVQDIVEEVLIKNGLADVAKAYIIYRQKRTELREAKKLLGVIDDLKLSVNSIRVLERRYLLRDERGNIIETPSQMFRRVAKTIASVDQIYDKRTDAEATEEKFYRMMANLEFLPNSPTLMNAGTELGQLAACFVIDVPDSIEGIFNALKTMALIHQSGGGTGFSFSKLRPAGDIVRSTKGVASGPISFMRIFDTATDVIKQGGRRRGANMGILRVDHPDIIEFITAKEKEGVLTNFNISVGITDDFMKAVAKNEEYDLINPRTGKPEKRLRARDVFDLIVSMAWRTGDPGLIFLDEINRHNPTPKLGRIESTNPCGEVPLLPYESCNLGSINLSKMVEDGQINWEKLRSVVRSAVHFLDNVIDANKYPLREIEEATKRTRKIGLGVMGFADMLIKLGIPYDSERAVAKAEEVMKFISDAAREKSVELSEQRGSFPAFAESIWKERGFKGLRNATLTTIAPTGSISIIANASSGIEPLFAISYVRNVMGTQLFEVNQLFEEVAKREGFYSRELMIKIAKRGSVRGMPEVPEDVQNIFATALDIAPEWHVRMQAAFQKYVDNAVAKCVTGDTWIFSENGLQRIHELYNGEKPDSFSLRPLRVAGNNSIVEAREFYYGGEQPVIYIETHDGLRIGATPVHRVRVLDEGEIKWRPVNEIKVGDTLVTVYGSNLFGNKYEFNAIYGKPFQPQFRTNARRIKIPYKITKELARLIGYVIADGGYRENGIYLKNENANIIKDFCKIAKKRLGIYAKIVPDKKTKSTLTASINSWALTSFFRDYLKISNRAETKTVPKVILSTSLEIQKEFLRGLSLDGYVSERGDLVPLCTTSRELAEAVQMMLFNIGIPTSLSIKKIRYKYKKTENKKKYYFRLTVVPDYRLAFIKRIGFADKRMNKLAIKVVYEKRTPLTSYVISGIDKKVENLLNHKIAKVGSGELYKKLTNLKKSIRAGHNLTREKVLWLLDVTRDLADTEEWKSLSHLVHNNYFFTKVKSISTGQEKVYDLHVPKENSFLTNGFISHNTVNLPTSATLEDVRRIFMMAYEFKCKGITVYRYGSKREQVLYVGPPSSIEEGPASGVPYVRVGPEYSGGCPSGICEF